jgi:hypothetical protein
MNVTIKINDDVCRDARHRAVDAGRSLSGWIEEVIHRELSRPVTKTSKTLLEALGNEQLAGLDFDFPRDKSPARDVDFS